MKGANATYWGNIREGWRSLRAGLILSFMHFRKAWIKKRRPSVGADDASYFDHKEGVFTNYYPHESLPVPDHGRYRLHNEVDDCIVCDKCAKVCPVDCIEIEALKDPKGEIRKASDGSSVRLHAAKFDIDMAKCMYCGLCTTVCPTECLTMTKTFDFSEFDIRDMVYEFSYMSEQDVIDKKKELEDFNAAKKAKQAEAAQPTTDANAATSPAKPKVVIPKPGGSKEKAESSASMPKPKIAKPKVVIPKPKTEGDEKPAAALKPKIAKPVIPAQKKEEGETNTQPASKPVMKPKMAKPVMKPKIPPKTDSEE